MRKVNHVDSAFIADRPFNLCLGSNATVRKQLSKDATFYTQSASPTSTPSYPPARNMMGTYVTLGVISAILSLFIVPEIFGSLAIILGAYIWRREQGNRGIGILILGIICMLVGLYFTSYFELGDLLPS